jgi:hypothetical protein
MCQGSIRIKLSPRIFRVSDNFKKGPANCNRDEALTSDRTCWILLDGDGWLLA